MAEKITIMDVEDAYICMQEHCGISVGDTVKVLRTAKDDEMGWRNNWTDYMDRYVQQTGLVEAIREGGIEIKFDNGRVWDFPFFVLELIEKDNG